MDGKWRVTPGISIGGGAGPLAGTVARFDITKPDGSTLPAVFYGAGGSVGGPASFTFSDKQTPGWPGDIIWGWGLTEHEWTLRLPSDGLILSVGTAPRQFLQYFGLPQDPMAIAGGYVMIVAFGVSSAPNFGGLVHDSIAAASILADIRFETRGKLLAGVRAYAAVATAAKGVDVGSASAMTGRWMFG